MIWVFKCLVCKKSKSHGREYRINSMNRWVCVDCIRKLERRKKKWMMKKD